MQKSTLTAQGLPWKGVEAKSVFGSSLHLKQDDMHAPSDHDCGQPVACRLFGCLENEGEGVRRSA